VFPVITNRPIVSTSALHYKHLTSIHNHSLLIATSTPPTMFEGSTNQMKVCKN